MGVSGEVVFSYVWLLTTLDLSSVLQQGTTSLLFQVRQKPEMCFGRSSMHIEQSHALLFTVQHGDGEIWKISPVPASGCCRVRSPKQLADQGQLAPSSAEVSPVSWTEPAPETESTDQVQRQMELKPERICAKVLPVVRRWKERSVPLSCPVLSLFAGLHVSCQIMKSSVWWVDFPRDAILSFVTIERFRDPVLACSPVVQTYSSSLDTIFVWNARSSEVMLNPVFFVKENYSLRGRLLCFWKE